MITTPNDIVHYYMGSKFQFTFTNGEVVYGTLEMINDSGMIFSKSLNAKDENDYIEIMDFRADGELKLILFHQSDMTVHQKKSYYRLCKTLYAPGKRFIVDTPESLNYLFSHSVDAFDLVERDLAISANWYFNKDILPAQEDDSQPPDGPFKEEKETVIQDERPYEFFVPFECK
jgi:hypothetical protein